MGDRLNWDARTVAKMDQDLAGAGQALTQILAAYTRNVAKVGDTASIAKLVQELMDQPHGIAVTLAVAAVTRLHAASLELPQ